MTGEQDPFGTAEQVERVLAAWAAAPERFREDANAEEDLVRGGYRDRLVVELAQNAADAAARSGRPGRLLLRLSEADGGVLVAANTGAPLDAAGALALATLRASAKRGPHSGFVPRKPAVPPDNVVVIGPETRRSNSHFVSGPQPVGRFGVGFAAVLAVTDCPTLLSRTGGVRFSRAETLALVRQAASRSPGLAAELERRGGHVPVLRLPFPAEGEPPSGFDSAALLPLRDGAACDLVVTLLEQVDDALLLALPALAEVVVELPDRPPRRLADVEDRWYRISRSGTHDAALLADRPTEERERRGWTVTWAVPREGGDPAVLRRGVAYAPTPTDEPLPWHALLVGTFPLEPTRRHVAPGPATDAFVAQAAEAYVDLLVRRARDGADVLPLIPLGLPAGPLDAQLRHALLPLLPAAPILPALEGEDLLRPRDAVALESGPWAGDLDVLRPLASVVAGLTPAPAAAEPALRVLGVRRLPLADLVEQLPAQPDAPSWARLYAALAPLATDTLGREALSALPVPLLDGRVVHGPRGAVLVSDDVPPAAVAVLTRLGQRVVAPAVAADDRSARLLERLGASRAGPAELLQAPELRDAVARQADGDPEPQAADELADAVLSLLAAADNHDNDHDELPARLPWLGNLLLSDDEGDLVPADLLVQPGSVAADLLDHDAVGTLAADLFAAWPQAVWSRVGVAGSLAAEMWREVDTSDLPDDLAELDAAHRWAEQVGPGTVAELAAVRDLDVVRPSAWPAALGLVAQNRSLRSALLDRVQVVGLDGRERRAPGYTAWWLRRELGLAGRASATAEPLLRALLPAPPEWTTSLDPAVASTLGLVSRWSDLDSEGWQDVLAALVTLTEPPPVPALLAMWAALGCVEDELRAAPAALWALRSGTPALVRGDEVAVADAPMWLQRPDVAAFVVVPLPHAHRVADALDLDLASERALGRVESRGEGAEVPDAVRSLLGDAAGLRGQAPGRWVEHDTLLVDGVDVEWWVEHGDEEATVHASTLSGLARALAQACGRWDLRLALEAALTSPDDAAAAAVEEAFRSDYWRAGSRGGSESCRLASIPEPG